MSLTLNELKTERVTTEVNVGTATAPAMLQVVFNPRVYSPRYLEELKDMDATDNRVWARMLSKLLLEWDLEWGTGDAESGLCKPEQVGKTIPVNEANLCEVPLVVLRLIANAIREKSQQGNSGGPPSGEATENGSSQEEEEGPLIDTGDSAKPRDTTAE